MYIIKRRAAASVRILRKPLAIFIYVNVVTTVLLHHYLKTCYQKLEFLNVFWPCSNKNRAILDQNTDTPFVRVEQVNCRAIINNNKSEINRTLDLMRVRKKRNLSPSYYLRMTQNCSQFLNQRTYIRKTLTTEEAEFSIAYSVMIYKDIEQFERLLRAIYRPQNFYCIHVDAKSPHTFHLAVKSISACFSNVFLASTRVKVRWGLFNVLMADLICMKDLWKRYKTWKYFINLTGQEFPLRTNNELVEVLRTFKGTADVRKSTLFAKSKRSMKQRILYEYKNGRRTERKMQKLPYDLVLTKAECHVALPRSFVDYIFQSRVAKDFLEWLKKTRIPDETYFPTLNNSPQLNIPGMYTGNRPRYARYKNWDRLKCHGKWVRGICINGIGDLHYITQKPHFFVNKFHLDFQYLTLDCMEEWFYNRTRAYYKGHLSFDPTPYIYYETR